MAKPDSPEGTDLFGHDARDAGRPGRFGRPGGPRNSSAAAPAPSTSTKTPSVSLPTCPARPRRVASRCTWGRNPTPWTRPATRSRRRTTVPERGQAGHAWRTAAPPQGHRRLAMHPPEVVVGRAGALRRDHAGADGCLGRARRAEDLALPRLDDPLEHLAALARLGVRHPDVGDRVAQLGVEGGELRAQLQTALRDEAQPAPLEVWPQLEDLGQHGQGPGIASLAHHPRVLVLDLAAALPDLREQHGDGVQDVERLEAGGDQGQPVLGRHEAVGALPDHGGDVARAEEAVEAEVGGLEDRPERGHDRDVVGEDGEVGHAPRPRLQERECRRRRGRLEAHGEEDHVAARVLRRRSGAHRAASRRSGCPRRMLWRRAGCPCCPGRASCRRRR